MVALSACVASEQEQSIDAGPKAKPAKRTWTAQQLADAKTRLKRAEQRDGWTNAVVLQESLTGSVDHRRWTAVIVTAHGVSATRTRDNETSTIVDLMVDKGDLISIHREKEFAYIYMADLVEVLDSPEIAA